MGNVKNPIRTIQTDFRSGEVDPMLAMRVDSKMYPAGARSLKNCILRSGGAVSRRPGSTRLADIAAEKVRILPFEFDTDEKYLIVLKVGALLVYDGAGTLITTFTSQPWTTLDMMGRVTYAQAGDTMVLSQESFKPRVLKRTSLTTFTLTEFAFEVSASGTAIYQPYQKFEAPSVTLDPSSTAVGTNTITASSPIFTADWVGTTIRIVGKEITITSYTSSTVIVGTNKARLRKKLDPNPLLSSNGSRLMKVTHPYHGLTTGASVTISGVTTSSDTPGNIGATEVNGTWTVTVVDEDSYTFTAGGSNNAQNSMDFGGANVEVAVPGAQREWDEPVFSTRRGWPAAVCFHEDRLWFGGSTSLPDGLFSSRTGFYYNFSVSKGEDDASIQVTVGAPRIAKVRHILAGRLLQVFSDGGEFVARQSDGVALTPSTVSVRPQTPYGCSSLRPMSFDGATLFVQGNAKTVREFTYDYNQDGFGATDLTTLSQHLLSGIVDGDVLYGSNSRTEQYAFFVNANGTIAVFHSNRAEGLAGWLPWQTKDGLFENVCVLGPRLYVIVNRAGTRVLERIELDNSAVLLDWSKSMTAGSATTSWALGSAYAAKTVHVTSNGWYLGTVTANGSGTITTSYPVTAITAGLSYDWEVVTLPPDLQLPEGPMTGENRRIVSALVHVLNTLSVSVNGQPVIAQQIGDDLSVPPAPISRKVKRYLQGYGRDPAVSLTQGAPLSVTILGMTLEVSF